MDRQSVLIFRDFPDERRVSMERYADALLASMGCVEGAVVQQALLPQRGGLGGALFRRYVTYPLLAGLHRSSVAHILDHGYADLARWRDPQLTVVTCHDLVLVRPELRRLPGFPERARMRFVLLGVPWLRRVQHVIAVSEATRRDLVGLLGVPDERITVIPMGVEGYFRPLSPAILLATRCRYDLPAGRLVVHVGHTGFYKNVEGLLRAFAPLVALGDPIWLVRVGPALTHEQEALVRELGIAERVVSREWVAEADLPAMYGLADVVCFPSWHEGFGWPVAEALACGVPVVAARVPALLEVAGDAAVFVAPGDVVGLTRALRRVLTDGEMGDVLRWRGVRQVRHLTWGRVAWETWQVYERVRGTCYGG